MENNVLAAYARRPAVSPMPNRLAQMFRNEPGGHLPPYPGYTEARPATPLMPQTLREHGRNLLAEMAGDAPASMGANTILGFAGGPAVMGTVRPVQGIRAYHGSPHRFDRFSLSRIGSGEGAQAYGHGLYFAENERVARGYRDSLSGRVNREAFRAANIDDAWVDAARSMWNTHSQEDIQKTLRSAYRSPPISDDQMRLVMERANPGSMYEVNLRVDPNRLLDWDAPLSQQPAAVREFLTQSNINPTGPGGRAPIGRDVYVDTGAAVRQPPGEPRLPIQANAARAFRNAGIPGIRYLDGGSRAAGDGTRNYVMFDDNLIDIIRRYGILGLLGGGAAAGAATQEY